MLATSRFDSASWICELAPAKSMPRGDPPGETEPAVGLAPEHVVEGARRMRPFRKSLAGASAPVVIAALALRILEPHGGMATPAVEELGGDDAARNEATQLLREIG